MTPRLQVLHFVREQVAAGRPYMCTILNDLANSQLELRGIALALQVEIQAGIDYHVSVGSWATAQLGMGHLESENMPEPYSNTFGADWLAQLCRLAWLDRLIENERTP